MAYIPTSIAKPAHLADVIGLVHDDDGLTRMLVYLHPDGRWLASQSECEIEFNVIAWAALPPLPDATRGLIWRLSKAALGWLSASERPACRRCAHVDPATPWISRVRYCRLGHFVTRADAICNDFQVKATS